MVKLRNFLVITLIITIFLISGCVQEVKKINSVNNIEPLVESLSRESKIPSNAVKMIPSMDQHPPILHSDEFEDPVPLDIINSAGAEDSPFISNYKGELFFFFTPDVNVPVEKQLLDGVTGIWVSQYQNGAWQEPKRVILQDSGKLSLDGCEFVQSNKMWFCTAREGYTGLHWATAERNGNSWNNWKVEDFPVDYEVGELHIFGNELYYHSSKYGSLGGTDIWMLSNVDGSWVNPVNIKAVNSNFDEGMPYITSSGNEMWFNRNYLGTPALYRSKRVNDDWQTPELMISQFAGEPTLDKKGNVYFVHHYYDTGKMIEADIYVAYKK